MWDLLGNRAEGTLASPPQAHIQLLTEPVCIYSAHRQIHKIASTHPTHSIPQQCTLVGMREDDISSSSPTYVSRADRQLKPVWTQCGSDA